VKKIIIILVAVTALLWLVKRKDMTWRQSILQAVYPALMKVNELTGKREAIHSNDQSIQPPVPFYSLSATTIEGIRFDFSQLKGKKVLLVNTASDCGYTAQFAELEELHQLYKNELVIIGFPANDFKEQEKGSNEEIASFCKKNFGVTFMLMQRGKVIKGEGQQPVYEWLTNKNHNGWNDTAPSWNFCKYLVNEQGILEHYFPTAVSPLSKMLKEKL
jgi:glutathione peroxidase